MEIKKKRPTERLEDSKQKRKEQKNNPKAGIIFLLHL